MNLKRMKRFEINLEVNGGEYIVSLRVICKSIDRIDNHVLKIDNILIEYPEKILSFEEIDMNLVESEEW